MNRLEWVLHVGIVKPLAWLLLWGWWLLCWVGRGIVHVGGWARQRWGRWHQARQTSVHRPARQVRQKLAA
jgi:hypothetical protein